MAGILSGRGILSGVGILSGRGIMSGQGIIPQPVEVDPLAGLALFRMEDSGFYQDTSFATPAVSDGATLGGWRDEITGSNLAFIAGTTAKIKILSGIKVAHFEGVSGALVMSGVNALFPAAASICVMFQPLSSTDYGVLGTVADAYDRFGGDGNAYPGLFHTPRYNAYRAMPTTGKHTLTTIAQAGSWDQFLDGVSGGVMTSGTYGSSLNQLVLGGGLGAGTLNGYIFAVIASDQIWATEQRETVEAYLTTKYASL